MDVRHLKAFLATYETGSVTSAAQRIHVTQPTLSATLQQLEERLGRALFERLPRGVRPTEEGMRLYPQARRLVAEWEAMTAQFDPGGDCISLSVGIAPDAGPWAQEALQRLLAQVRPVPLLKLLAGDQGDLRLDMAHQRRADEGFVLLSREPVCVMLPVRHVLAGHAILSPSDLQGQEWIVCPDLPWHASLVEALGASAPYLPAHAASPSMMPSWVAAGHGLAAVPASLAALAPDAEVVLRPLAGWDVWWETGLCFRPGAMQLPGPAALISAAQQAAVREWAWPEASPAPL